MISSGIYTITSPSGNQYVGSASSFGSRWGRHLSDLRKGIHHSAQLQRAFNKYGETDQVFQSGKAAGDWCVAQGLTSNTCNKTVINYAIRTSTRAYGYHWVEDNAR